jgi:tetratricopeptide (TPR) repeat protein
VVFRKQTIDVEAYQFYLQGRYYLNKRHQGLLDKAIVFFQEAINQDPTYSLAYSGLADSFSVQGWYNFENPNTAYTKAKSNAILAIQHCDTLSEGYVSLAYINHHYDWDWESANRNYQKAIDLNSNYSIAHHWYALFLASMDRFDEALVSIRFAKTMDPCSSVITTAEAWVYYMQGDFQESQGVLEQANNLDTQFSWQHYVSGQVHEALNDLDMALQQYKIAFELSGDSPFFMAGYGHILGLCGKNSAARKIFKELELKQQGQFISSLDLALCGMNIFDQEFLLDLVDKSLDQKVSAIPYLKQDWRLKNLLRDYDLETKMMRRRVPGND